MRSDQKGIKQKYALKAVLPRRVTEWKKERHCAGRGQRTEEPVGAKAFDDERIRETAVGRQGCWCVCKHENKYKHYPSEASFLPGALKSMSLHNTKSSSPWLPKV